MKIKLFLFTLLAAAVPVFAQKAAVSGSVVEADTGNPISGALVTIADQGITVTTGPAGDFLISNANPGSVTLSAIAYGYADATMPVDLYANQTVNVGQIAMSNNDLNSIFYEEAQDMWFDENALDDEEGGSQSIQALTGASDDIYYNAQSYNFQPMYYRYRGYDSQYQSVYLNGIELNDLGRGRFSYSTLGGMTSRAFRNRTNTIGIGAAAYGFGDIGGSTNFNTITSSYSPGFNGSVAYTNSNYMLRAMATYSTGINKDGWGLTVSGIGRWADEGVIDGTFYNSFGAFISLEKVFNQNHSLTLTAFGAPIQRGATSASYQEIFDLVDDNTYNPSWGWQDGKKRSAKVVEQFDPTAMLNWIFKNEKTIVNTGAAIRWTHYSTTGISRSGNSPDPRPDYYKRLPSAYYDNGLPTSESDLVADAWRTGYMVSPNGTHVPFNRQIDWDGLYQANYLANIKEKGLPFDERTGSVYVFENRVSNQFQFHLNSTVNHRITDAMSLQGGVQLNYTKADYFKTVRDLLGGDFWRDIDTFAERDFPDDPNVLQNDLNNPNRRVGKGDRFGYDYTINAVQVTGWLQNMITLPNWDINYGLKIAYTQFQRDGHMRNGRAPENSFGKGDMHRFDTGAFKAGVTYKADGRNFFMGHVSYETRAPLFEYSYISPRIKDTAIEGLGAERILTGDLSYVWNYRRFRGAITGFWTDMSNLTERTSYYDDQYGTFMNYVLKGVKRQYKGIELGMAYKITPSLTASLAGTWARYQYKCRPTGIKSYENGMMDDIETKVYLNNFFVGGTPQTAVNVGLDWAAPKQWFFNVNASWMGDAYVQVSPIRHEELPDLWQHYPDKEELEQKMASLASQDKMKNAFVLNASIGKLIYLNRQASLNINLSATNLLNNRNIMTNAYQQGRFDYTNYDAQKFPNKYQYAQGIRIFLNMGIRF